MFHYNGLKGYAQIYCFVLFIAFLVTNAILTGFFVLGVNLGKILPSLGFVGYLLMFLILVFPFLLAGFITAGRFLQLEERKPDADSVIKISGRAFAYVVGYFLVLLIVTLIILKLTDNVDQMRQTVNAFSGLIVMFGLFTLISSYLNLSLGSRFRFVEPTSEPKK